MSGKIKEKGMEILFLACALASIAAVAVICLFLFMGGIPAIGEIGAGEFLLGRKWAPQDVPASFGIFPMILGSVYVTGGAILLGVPVGILAAVFLARFCPRPAYRVLGPAVQLMAGIPSIVYGFFGMVVIVPFIREHFRRLGAVNGSSILAASILLGIMILPTVIGVSESALRAVPQSYYEGALALGATHERGRLFRGAARRQKRHSRGGGARRRPRHRRDDGGHHGRRQPAADAGGASSRGCAR